MKGYKNVGMPKVRQTLSKNERKRNESFVSGQKKRERVNFSAENISWKPQISFSQSLAKGSSII